MRSAADGAGRGYRMRGRGTIIYSELEKPPPEPLKKSSHGVVQRWKTLAVGNSGTRRD